VRRVKRLNPEHAVGQPEQGELFDLWRYHTRPATARTSPAAAD
jgi:hypothetical protein